MFAQCSRLAFAAILFGSYVVYTDCTPSQEILPPPRGEPAPAQAAAPEIPKGVEVQARGPIHEAFAAPTTEPKQPLLIPKKPPLPIEELPPEEKPDGNVAWIGGYFGWDDDRADFMWVSGCWRIKPASKEWVPGYWREVGENWQWVAGFWTAVQEEKAQPVTYYPEPPAPPNVAPPGEAPRADMMYVPGYYMWNGDRYIWRAGYWTPGRPDYVYVPSHYRWTPYGYVYVAGYWDLAVSRRGVLYAPIVVDVVVVGRGYRYTPYYAVRDTVVLDTLFVRPAFGAYYFGDYYGPRYVAIGFEPGVVYGRRHYDPLIVHERWVYRDNPRWHETQLTLVVERNAGRAPLPPRRLEVGRVSVTLAPTRTVLAVHGLKSTPLSPVARAQIHETAVAHHQALAADRRRTESSAAGPPTAPRASALSVHAPTPAGGHTAGTVGGNPMGSTGKGATDLKGAATTHPDTKGPGVGANPMPDPHKGTGTGKTGTTGKKDEGKKKSG
jgi:hypothetical protein